MKEDGHKRIQIKYPLDGFALPFAIGHEYRTSPEYYHESKTYQRNYCTFQYTLDGEGRFQKAGREYILSPGKAFLFAYNEPDVCYYYPKENRGKPWEFIYLDFMGKPGDIMMRSLINKYGPICSLPLKAAIIRRLLLVFENGNNNMLMTASNGASLVTELLCSIAEHQELANLHVSEDFLLKKILDDIKTNIKTRPQVSDIARHLNISREHLSRIFRKHMGLTPYQYIQKQSMLEACNMIRHTDKPMKEIAHELGFEDPDQFSRTFLRVLGITASNYRKHHPDRIF